VTIVAFAFQHLEIDMRIQLAAFAALFPATLALAEPTLPSEDAIKGAATPDFVYALVNASVAGEHCEGFEVTETELALLTSAVPVFVQAAGIDQETYELEYDGKAYAAIFINETCAEDGPKVKDMLQRLTELGAVAE
jgi:hypothetical protein